MESKDLHTLPLTVTYTEATDTSTAATAFGGIGWYVVGVAGLQSAANLGAYIVTGTSAVAAASATNGTPIPAGVATIRIWIDGVTRTHFRILRMGSSNSQFYHGAANAV